jgi:acetyl-CoA synthetase
VLDDSQPPFFKWFVGAKTNIVHNAIDRHLKTHRKNQLALIWESEDGKDHRTFSYFAMNREVSRMANIIKAMGIQGDRVTITWDVPEIVFAMMACEDRRFTQVFGGSSVDSSRKNYDSKPNGHHLMFLPNGKVVELKPSWTNFKCVHQSK